MPRQAAALVTLSERRQAEAMARFAALRPYLEEGASLIETVAAAGVALRTAERWVARFRVNGLAGLARPVRSDAGTRRTHDGLVALVEGMGLKRPRLSAAAIHRQVSEVARTKGWRIPSYGAVHAILARLDPGMVCLAQDGHAAYRDRFELIYRHRAEGPNALWQADHTLLDILILDADGKPVRPWLTVVIDDYSRAIAGYLVSLDAPCALNTSLALRQAIWRKADPSWQICGVPDVLYVDHGSDFTSRHLERVAADLHIRLIHSAVARPQGRGKIERFFGTINAGLLPELAGAVVHGRPTSPPRLSLAELDSALSTFVRESYNCSLHSGVAGRPCDVWRGKGFLPRLPESLEALDLLLVLHATPRTVRRDGIRFQGLRYVSPVLAAFVREAITVRYDPRDLAEIRVFHRDAFLCVAVSEQYAGRTVTLKDLAAARLARRRALRTTINERVARMSELLHAESPPYLCAPRSAKPRSRLRLYEEDR